MVKESMKVYHSMILRNYCDLIFYKIFFSEFISFLILFFKKRKRSYNSFMIPFILFNWFICWEELFEL